MSEHRDIWLQPWCPSCATFSDVDRLWCQDEVWERCESCDAMPVRFIRQDIADAEIGKLRAQLDAAVRELGMQGRELGKAEADRDRLRTALDRIIQTGRLEGVTAPTALGYVLKIAREALEVEG